MSNLEKAIEGINKTYGEGSVMELGSTKHVNVDAISSGSIGLDLALGVGGFPRGRIVEIYGQESSAKTTIAIHAIAEAQKLGGKCVVVDVEHAFDKAYAEALGVDTSSLFISQPGNAEESLEIADRLICSGEIAVIVIDSVAALVPKSELEGEMGDSKMGLHARLMSQALRKMTGSIYKTNTLCIFINQMREKIGVSFGNPWTTPGGNGLKFYATIRIEVSKHVSSDNQVKDGKDIVGNLIKAKVVKNKVAPPFKTCEFNVIYGVGIDRLGEMCQYGSDLGVIDKAGSWYSYEGAKIGQGVDAVRKFLLDNPNVSDKIYSEIKAKISPPISKTK